MRRVFVVGCGHSGTSILKRTIANLPGMHCIPKESQLFFKKGGRAPAQRKQLAEWDQEAAAAGFTGWVEKTPKHIEKVEEIWRADPGAKVVFVVRDGRDVAASLVQRRIPLQEALKRWVDDNTRILPHLDDPRLLAVRFEDFGDERRVLGVLRHLSEFVGAQAPDERLLLALQASSAELPPGHHCAVFGSEEAKAADLTASYLQLLSGSAEALKRQAPNQAKFHNRYRSWQASLPWMPQHGPTWRERLTCEQQQGAAADQAVRDMLQRFNYSWEVQPGSDSGANGTACQLDLSAQLAQSLDGAAASTATA